MAQQKRPRETTPEVNCAETHLTSAVERGGNGWRRDALRFLPAALFCLTLSLHALAQGAATEVSVQVIPSATTLKCNEHEYKLAAVRANMPAQPAAEATLRVSALGVALVPTGAGDAKVFARYWFLSKDPAGASAGQWLLKRDNDNGQLGKQLIDFDESSFGDNVTKFLKACKDDKAASAVFQALTQTNPLSSVGEVQTAFHTAGLELDSGALTSEQKNIGQPLNIADAGQVLFAQAMRELLLKQFGKGTSTVEASPSPPVTHAPDADGQAAASGELRAITERLEGIGKQAASLSALLSILLGVLVTVLVAAFFLAALFYFRPTLQRKIFFGPEDAAEIRRQALDELYQGLQKISDPVEARNSLTKILDESEKQFGEANEDPTKTVSVYRALQNTLRTFSLSLPADKNGGHPKDETDITSVRQFISDNFSIKFAESDLAQGLTDITAALHENLRPLVGNDPKFPLRVLPQLEVARQHVEAMWSKYSGQPCPEGALTLLRQAWESIQDALQPLNQVSPEHKLARVWECVALFDYLREKFPDQSQGPQDFQGPRDLKSKVERFFNDLNTIRSAHLTTDAQSNSTPDDILVSLDDKLQAAQQTLTEFTVLRDALGALRQELPSSNGAQSDPLAQATQMAKNHKEVLALLNDYRPTGDRDNITETARSVQTKIQSAATVVSTLIPGASGTIDVMVSDLAKEFDSKVRTAKKAEEFKERAERLQRELTESKAQAEVSTKLAGALSRYVNLSAEGGLDPEQVRNILQRFSTGERTHRQLRLRLSAATSALDEAIEEVRRASREDALDALRTGDFMDPLRRLLTNMEDFRGDAMWGDCLSSGFSDQWLHNLLRAELLARTYFTEDGALSPLIAPLAEAVAALRVTMRHLNVRVPFISLLSKPPAGARVDYEVDPRLSGLQEVRRKVQATLRSQSKLEDGFNFIVDVGLFPFQSDSAEKFGGRVFAVSPAEWV